MASAAAKRISGSSINWKQLSEKLIPDHLHELNKLKGQNTVYSAMVQQLPPEPPKVDFAALKKSYPAHSAVLDSLQKQYDSIKVPYPASPSEHLREIELWNEYNKARTDLHAAKTNEGDAEAKKIESRWAKAPPIEHMTLYHLIEYFPLRYADCRYLDYINHPIFFADPIQLREFEYSYKQDWNLSGASNAGDHCFYDDTHPAHGYVVEGQDHELPSSFRQWRAGWRDNSDEV